MDALFEPNVEFNEGTDEMDFNLDWKDGFVDTPVLPSTICSSASPLAAWNSFNLNNATSSTKNPEPKSSPQNNSTTVPGNSQPTSKIIKQGKRKKIQPPPMPSSSSSAPQSAPGSTDSANDTNGNSSGLGPTRIRRQYNCESCSFRTINPREFLYHRRDTHGAKVKIVECPYCVYACQYFQKLQRHILLVHKLETVTTPPTAHNSPAGSQVDSVPKKVPLAASASTSKAASSKGSVSKKCPIPGTTMSNNQSMLKMNVFEDDDVDEGDDHALIMDESDVDDINTMDDDDDPTSIRLLVVQNAIYEDSPDGQIIKCRACGYSTDVDLLFRSHVKDHSAPKNKCDHCDFETAFSYLLDRHMSKVHPHESAQYTSPINSNKSFTCVKCAFTTDSLEVHSQHVSQCQASGYDGVDDDDDNVSQADSSKNMDDNNDTFVSGVNETTPGSKANPHSTGSTQNLTMRSGTVNIIQTPGSKEATIKLLHCAYCEFTHKESKSMVSHLSVHTGRKPYKCRLCEFSSNWKEVVARHAKSRHSGSNLDVEQLFKYTVNKFICRVVDETGDLNLCPEVTFADDIKSRETHEETSPLVQSAFSSPVVTHNEEELSLPVHAATAVSSAVAQRSAYGYSGFKGQFKCDLCPFRAEKAFHIDFHVKRHTQAEGADFKCPHCPYWVNAKKSLTRHIYLHDCENGTAVPPDELEDDEADAQADLLCETVSTATNNNAPSIMSVPRAPKATSTNGNKFSSSGDQNVRSLNASNGENATSNSVICNSLLNKRASARNRCDACPFIAGTKTQLLYHKQFHRPNRISPYKCPHCTYTVSHQHLLNQHLKVHFRSSADGSYSSSTSNCELENSLALPVNQSDQMAPGNDDPVSHSNDISFTVVNNIKIFQCTYCPTSSRRKNYIIVHQQQHEASNSQDDTCQICYLCNFTTWTKKIFLKHLDAHSLEEDNDKQDDQHNDSYDNSSLNELPPSKRFKMNNYKSGNGVNGFTSNGSNGSKKETYQTYTCSYCPAVFKCTSDLKYHSMFHSSSHFSFSCDLCSYRAMTEQQLTRHKIVHTSEYVNERRGHNVSSSNSERCPLSPELSSIASLNIDFDLSTLDLDNIRPSLVEKIGFHIEQLCFIEKSETDDYLDKIKSPNRHPFIYKCNSCPASFSKSFTLKFHKTLHGYNGAINCNMCNYGVDFEENLKSHQQLHLNSNVPSLNSSSMVSSYNHKCNRCPAAFSKPSRLEKHLSLHGSGAKWMCDKCDYAVPYAATLVKHRHVHENEVDSETVSQVDSHPLANSNQQLVPLNLLPEGFLAQNEEVAAANVGKSSSRSTNANGEKTLFLCDRCPYSHARRDAVLSHEKRHEQERCVRDGKKCPHCDYVCLQPSYLREHIRLHFEAANGRQPKLYRSFDDIELRSHEILDGLLQGDDRILFKDSGKDKDLKDRFEPHTVDEELNDLYKTSADDDMDEDLVDDEDAGEDDGNDDEDENVLADDGDLVDDDLDDDERSEKIDLSTFTMQCDVDDDINDEENDDEDDDDDHTNTVS